MPSWLKPILSPADIERIHAHSLDLLERVGIDYKTPRALDVLAEYGCPVDRDTNWARLPRDVVAWALEQAPRVVPLEARDPARTVVLDGRASHHTTDSQGTEALDFETGERRNATLADLERGLRLADALDQVDIVNVMVAAGDVPAHQRTVQHFASALTQTSKPIRTGVLNAEQVPLIVDLVRAATGEDTFRPVFSVVDCTISPLMHDGPMTEACIELARLNVPIMVYPMPLAGGTSPVTSAGTVLLHNVEFLSGLALFQMVRPGTPVIYGTGASKLDMQTGRWGGGADEHAMRLGLLDMARFYDLPANLWGLSTASSALDAQYGHEATTAGLLARLAGADEIYSMGLLGSSQVLSLEKMVIDNHLARQIDLMVQPFPVDAEYLQADLIEQVGIGGHYLAQPETRAFTRRDFVPKWPPVGTMLADIARTEAADVLATHRPPPLPDGAADRLAEIVAQADKVLI